MPTNIWLGQMWLRVTNPLVNNWWYFVFSIWLNIPARLDFFDLGEINLVENWVTKCLCCIIVLLSHWILGDKYNHYKSGLLFNWLSLSYLKDMKMELSKSGRCRHSRKSKFREKLWVKFLNKLKCNFRLFLHKKYNFQCQFPVYIVQDNGVKYVTQNYDSFC